MSVTPIHVIGRAELPTWAGPGKPFGYGQYAFNLATLQRDADAFTRRAGNTPAIAVEYPPGTRRGEMLASRVVVLQGKLAEAYKALKTVWTDQVTPGLTALNAALPEPQSPEVVQAYLAQQEAALFRSFNQKFLNPNVEKPVKPTLAQ